MLESVHFVYDGIKSVDMGVLNCTIEGGMFEETFLARREIMETTISGRDKPYFQDIKRSPLEFKLVFAFDGKYTDSSIREVARWLSQDYYKPFYTVENPDRIFYCMLDDESHIIHNGLKEGYVELTMRCDGAYSYTPKYEKNNLKILSQKYVKNITENTFINGTHTNTTVDSSGNLVLETKNPIWSDYSGLKWSDL